MAALAGEARGSRRHATPDAVTDALLLRAFPGRTLEELDAMDWGRWRRAVEAQTRLDVEALRVRYLAGDLKAGDMPAGVWAMIQEHDALVGDEDGEG